MRSILLLLSASFLVSCAFGQQPDVDAVLEATRPANNTFCVSFSPYVNGLSPDYGPQPTPELVGTLLDKLVQTGQVKCIYTFGSTRINGVIPEMAQARGLKVILTAWLSNDTAANQAETLRAITLAKQYPETVIALNCGSEVRYRLGAQLATEVVGTCIRNVRAAAVRQPVSTSDVWPAWCNDNVQTCSRWEPIGSQVDIILVTAFPWWENIQGGGRFPCFTAEGAAGHELDRFAVVKGTYPDKPVILSEFGWPAGPEGFTPSAPNAGCAKAGAQQQMVVMRDTFAQFERNGFSAIAFSAFNEPWKAVGKQQFEAYWGLCDATAPYNCRMPKWSA